MVVKERERRVWRERGEDEEDDEVVVLKMKMKRRSEGRALGAVSMASKVAAFSESSRERVCVM